MWTPEIWVGDTLALVAQSAVGDVIEFPLSSLKMSCQISWSVDKQLTMSLMFVGVVWVPPGFAACGVYQIVDHGK